ncbi:MAG: PAS domain S-box protein [Balneolaceae bacterium]
MKDSNSSQFYSTIKLDHLSSHVLNALNAHIALLDVDGKVVAHNKKWKEFGEQLPELSFRPGLNENFLQSLQAPLSEGNDFALRMLLGCKAVLSGNEETFELNYPVEIDNKKHWFKATLNRLQNDMGAVFIHEDIREQVQSRQYIRETQQKFEQYFENNLYGIVVANEDNKVIEINKIASRLLESSPDKLLFQDINKFLNLNVDIKEVQKRINGYGNFMGELELSTAEGNLLPVEMHVSIFRNEHGIPVTSWMFKDNSEKRKSEEALKISDKRYRLQFENSQEGIILAKSNGTILEANPAACSILGYEPHELANTHRSLILDAEVSKNKGVLEQREKMGLVSGEVEFVHKNGQILTADLNSSIYTLENGEQQSIINFKNISARKVIEEQLLHEQNFTESIISSLPNTFFVFDSSGKIIRWNKKLEQDFGYTADEIPELNILNLIHPDDRPLATEYLSVDHSGNTVSIEIRCITRQGEVLHYHISGKGFKQNGNNYTVGGGINLNDLKKVEDEKKRSSELLSQLFHNSPIGIVLIEQDGRVRNSNGSFEAIFGYTSDELKGKILDEIVVPAQLCTEAINLSNHSFTGESFQAEAIRIRKDGKEIPVLIGGVPVKIDGEIIASYGMYVDITERKYLENQVFELLEGEKKARLHMEDMFEESPSAIAMLEGENHIFTYTNEECRNLLGIDDLIGKSVVEAMPELVEQGFLESLNDCYKKGSTAHFQEKAIEFKSPSKTAFLNFIYKPLFDDNLEVCGIFIHAINVTEQVEARNTIEKSLREKETLLTEVHHRVKNNLAIISGLLELEIMDTEDEKVVKHLGSTQSRISTIAKIHEMLYQNESLSHVSFSEYVENMLKKEIPRFNSCNTNLISYFDLDEVQLNVNQAIPAGMLLNEVMSHLADFCTKDSDSGMELFLKENGDTITIKIIDLSNTVLKQYEEQGQNISSLRKELINVLLKQTRGEMDINLKEQHSLTISFDRRETKGPHNALTQ